MKKQSFLKASIILIASAVIAKAVGAVFKIPLTNMLGGVGMSYFSCAYGLFLPVYALTATGLTTAVAKLTAENCVFENYKNARKLQKISLIIFSLAGFLGTVAVILLAKPFCNNIASCPKAVTAVVLIAPSVFFGCITAVYRGCWEGMRNMYPTAVSQIIEAVIKLLSGLFLCNFVLENPERVLSFFPEGTEITAVAAAAAVLGISISTFAGCLFMFILGTGIEKDSATSLKGCEESTRSLIKKLMKIVIPVALGSLVTNLTSLVDLSTIIRCLDKAIEKNPDYFFSHYNLNGLTTTDLSEFIYGSFSGLAITIFNLVPSVTNMFGKGILPSIAESWAKNDKSSLENLSENVLKATAFIAIPSGIGITFLSEPILCFLFPQRLSECSVAAESLAFLGIAVIFLSLSFPMFSCLQAIGRADIPLKLMALGVLIKLSGNLILIPAAKINVSGAAISTFLCYTVIFILSFIIYTKTANIKIKIIRLLLPYLFSGIFCGLTANTVYSFLPFGNTLSLPVSICCGGIIYLIITSYIDGKPLHINKKYKAK